MTYVQKHNRKFGMRNSGLFRLGMKRIKHAIPVWPVFPVFPDLVIDELNEMCFNYVDFRIRLRCIHQVYFITHIE